MVTKKKVKGLVKGACEFGPEVNPDTAIEYEQHYQRYLAHRDLIKNKLTSEVQRWYIKKPVKRRTSARPPSKSSKYQAMIKSIVSSQVTQPICDLQSHSRISLRKEIEAINADDDIDTTPVNNDAFLANFEDDDKGENDDMVPVLFTFDQEDKKVG
jgi:hypothetical protein